MAIKNVKGFELCICQDVGLVNLCDCTIGKGTKIAAFVEILGATIGANCEIQTGAVIPPGVTISNNVLIGANVTFNNVRKPRIGKLSEIVKTLVCNGAVISAGAIILPGVTIGENAFIGTGAIVVKDVPDNGRVFGYPAK